MPQDNRNREPDERRRIAGVGVLRPDSTARANRPESTRESSLRLLLVEGSDEVAASIQQLLSEAIFTAHHVTRVNRLTEAIGALSAVRFDALLLDLRLPDSSGLETLLRIQPRAAELALPIVVLSESADETVAIEATTTGAQDYLIQGEFQARVLIRTIQHAIDRQAMEVRLDEARERELYLGTHDRLTTLPNRALFIDRLSQALLTARRHQRWLAVLFLDLDRFNMINETLGQSVGDRILQVTARRVQGALRGSDTTARISGDVFAVLLSELSQGLDAAKVAQNIERSLAPPFRLLGTEVSVTASIGIAIYPDDGIDPAALMGHAEMALKSAKESGGRRRRFYTAGMNASSLRLLTLEADLRRAIETDQEQLVLHYQPIVDGRTGQITGAEALARWNHPDLGLISPGEFIPIAETRGLMSPLGAWVLRAACLQLRDWRMAGHPPIPVAVNVSPTQFWDADFLGLLMQTLQDTDVDGRLLQVEITEGCVIRDVDMIVDALDIVQQFGVQTSIDDFGTGFSSLSVLRRLPLDALKIDRSFVNECTRDAGSATVTTAIIGLAKSMGLRVIAEGVETEEQRRFLVEHGGSTMQGFLFSRPRPVDQFTELIAAGQPLLHAQTPADR
jgi:diguanylate cyclase (GGDEF)-like protein